MLVKRIQAHALISCYITPEVYKITIYEMGLCTADPLAGTYVNSSDDVVTDYAIDESSCSSTFKNSNGSLVNLAGGASQNSYWRNRYKTIKWKLSTCLYKN